MTRAREQRTEANVLELLIKYKTEHDGTTPTLDQMRTESGMSTQTIRRALVRLNDAGKISYNDDGRYRNIRVIGGRWIFEGR
jgi:hypothetical protein